MIPVLAGVGAMASTLALGLALWIVGAWCVREIRRQVRQNRDRWDRARKERERFEDALRRTKSPTYPLPREPKMVTTRRRDW